MYVAVPAVHVDARTKENDLCPNLPQSLQTPHGTEDEGKVEGYYIGYRVAALDQNSNPQYNFKTFSLLPEYTKPRVTFELDGLRKNTEYTIHVQPFNAKGAGPSSSNYKIKTLEFGKFAGILYSFQSLLFSNVFQLCFIYFASFSYSSTT